MSSDNNHRQIIGHIRTTELGHRMSKIIFRNIVYYYLFFSTKRVTILLTDQIHTII